MRFGRGSRCSTAVIGTYLVTLATKGMDRSSLQITPDSSCYWRVCVFACVRMRLLSAVWLFSLNAPPIVFHGTRTQYWIYILYEGLEFGQMCFRVIVLWPPTEHFIIYELNWKPVLHLRDLMDQGFIWGFRGGEERRGREREWRRKEHTPWRIPGQWLLISWMSPSVFSRKILKLLSLCLPKTVTQKHTYYFWALIYVCLFAFDHKITLL